MKNRKYDLDAFFNAMRDMSVAKLCCKIKQKPARTGVYVDTEKNKFKKMINRPGPSYDPKPTFPYKFHIQFASTKNFVKIPLIGKNQSIRWDCVVNRKTLDGCSG